MQISVEGAGRNQLRPAQDSMGDAPEMPNCSFANKPSN